MAMNFHTSPSNLSHFFKKSTGQTISHFIDDMKVKRAEQLLLAG
jgi:AraC-like DNA-binding protein